jgi:hypothetical protein
VVGFIGLVVLALVAVAIWQPSLGANLPHDLTLVVELDNGALKGAAKNEGAAVSGVIGNAAQGWDIENPMIVVHCCQKSPWPAILQPLARLFALYWTESS